MWTLTAPDRLEWVGQLPDGSLFGKDNQPGVTYLSSGTGFRREWTTVEVRASVR